MKNRGWGGARLFLIFLVSGTGLLRAQEYPIGNSDNLDQLRTSAAMSFNDGKWEEARKTELEALQIAQGKWGPVHPALVPFLDDLGAVDRRLGLYPEALRQYQWALAIQQRALDPNDPALALSWDNLASLYDDLGRSAEAELSERQALQVNTAAGTPDNLGRSRMLENFERIEIHQGKARESERDGGQALEMAEKSLGDADSRLVPWMEGLAWACAKNGNFSKGEELLQKALKLQIRNTMGSSVESADCLKALADYRWASGDKGKAKAYYGQALRNYLRLSPFGSTMESLGHEERAAQCEYRLGQYQPAAELLGKVCEALPQITGTSSPALALSLAELSAAQKALGRKDEAEKNMGEALRILRNDLGKDHPLCLSLEKDHE